MFQLFFSSWKTVFHLNFNNRKFILILEADPNIYITFYIKWKTSFSTLVKFLSFLWSYYIVKRWIVHAKCDPWVDICDSESPIRRVFAWLSIKQFKSVAHCLYFLPPCPTMTRIFHTGKNYFMNEKNWTNKTQVTGVRCTPLMASDNPATFFTPQATDWKTGVQQYCIRANAIPRDSLSLGTSVVPR